MKKTGARRSQAAHAWGILLGMAGVPILALMSKVFPNLDTLWGALLVVFALVIVRSAIGYLFPGSPSGKKGEQATTHATAQSH
jgi:SNF family Na+-dependent transporter